MLRIDLNSDLGEGIPGAKDEVLLTLVSSANIACGGHAGDIRSMKRTVRLASEVGVRIGAHPSFPDRDNFGRFQMSMRMGELRGSLENQISALIKVAQREGASVDYFKPHGALYHEASKGLDITQMVLELARQFGMKVMVMANSPIALQNPAETIKEGFIDRAYLDDTTLLGREHTGALIVDPIIAAKQALRLAGHVDSLCVHSDTPNALELLTSARDELLAGGYEIASL